MSQDQNPTEAVVQNNWDRIKTNIEAGEREIATQPFKTLDDVLAEADSDE